MVIASVAEVLSIGALIPFIGAVTAPDALFDHPNAQAIIQRLNLLEPNQLLLPMTIAFCCAAIFAGGVRILLVWAQTKFSYAIGADLSFSIYRRALYQPYRVHLAHNTSELISGISNKANMVAVSIIMPLATILSSLLMLSSILITLLVIDPLIAFTAFFGFGSIYLSMMLVSKKVLAADGSRINYEAGRVIKALQEGFGGIRDVLIDGTQAIYCQIYRDADLPLRRAQANIAIIGNSPRFGVEALGMVLIATLAYLLARQPSGIQTAIPILAALALGAQRLLPVLQQAYASWTRIRGGQAPLKAVLDLLDQPLPAYLDAPRSPSVTFQREITLSNLSFRYAESGPWVISKGLNLSIAKGSRVGFIGATGSGKSTLLDIIMGLLEPVQGALEIDGIEITQANHRGWQSHIAHVPQSIFLADTTVSENIAFGVPADRIDHDRVRQAAQMAQIAEVIESWKDQYNTLVGERGLRLSGGQRQRIGIARALYKQASVIVLDEATSALDGSTERRVMEAIEGVSAEVTVIIVAHRLTTLKTCTQIIELDAGKVTKTGTYDEIIG